MSAAGAEKCTSEKEDHVQGSVVFYFKRAAYDVFGEKTVEGVAAVQRGEADLAAGGERLLLNGIENGAEVLGMQRSTERKQH